MDRSQSLNASSLFDGSNYAFWKVHMRAFLCSIDESAWDAVKVGWTRLEAIKSTSDKVALVVANANSKALNAIFCGVSPNKFHRISHVTIAKEACEILETTYEGTKKVKETKLQMLTTRFEELKMSEDESFDFFYGKLNEVVIGKFNLDEKTEDSKVVRKILQSLPESFRAKVTTIEESKDFDKIKIQELIVTCYECKGHGHVKKECLTYLKAKGKVFATTLSDLDSSNSDSEESCDREGNYSAFMTIALVDSLEDLSTLVKELGEHTEVESMGVGEESDDENEEYIYEGVKGLQESYKSLLEKIGEYASVAKGAIRKMKKAEQDYKSILMRYKETICEVETMNEKLTNAYSRIKFLELEVIQANAKVERVAPKKLDEVLAYQKPSFR
ncbi:uncharacterized protein LOC112006690 [Quercus suber]|uniref:uncharacterized protein LOC112006690 n=1 Tax=Quercus suber TaxID=58331 RepID=UPI000CE184DF|nr:uncharacterized protein LOC112006690 [Quercus suber]